MKTAVAVISIISLFITAEAFAQRGMGWQGSGGWGHRSDYARMYDPKTVETITGEVESVGQFTPTKGMRYGIHLILKTGKEAISVHLGPAWYIENQDTRIEPKDKIEVKGSRITFGGKPVIIAAQINKGDQVLKLRDQNGFPVWSGWRRR